jgi:hypothetical protein
MSRLEQRRAFAFAGVTIAAAVILLITNCCFLWFFALSRPVSLKVVNSIQTAVP